MCYYFCMNKSKKYSEEQVYNLIKNQYNLGAYNALQQFKSKIITFEKNCPDLVSDEYLEARYTILKIVLKNVDEFQKRYEYKKNIN